MINESGLHEIAVHGWIHELNTALDATTEERLLRQAVEEIETISAVASNTYLIPAVAPRVIGRT